MATFSRFVVVVWLSLSFNRMISTDVSVAATTQTGGKENALNVATFVGLNPQTLNDSFSRGCLLKNVVLSWKSVKLPSENTIDPDEDETCGHHCGADSACEGAVERSSFKCYFYKELSFETRGKTLEDIFVRDCRRHFCVDSCHCYDGDIYKKSDECRAVDEQFAIVIKANSTKQLVRVKKFDATLTRQALDASIEAESNSRETIEVIVLRNTNIRVLEDDVFFEMSALRYLNLDYNRLSDIPEGLFKDLSNLEALMLVNNQFDIFRPDTFRALQSLKYLDLSNNPITRYDGGVFNGLNSLLTLHLKTDLTLAFDDSVFEPLSNLKYLTISGGSPTASNPYPSYNLSLLFPLRNLDRLYSPATYNSPSFQTPPAQFEPACLSDNCYTECADITPLNHKAQPNVVYDFYYDLSRLNSVSRDLLIHSQTAVLRKGSKLTITDQTNWLLLTRELYIDGTVSTKSNNEVMNCKIRVVTLTKSRNIFHFQYAGFRGYADKIYIRPGALHPGTCDVNNIVEKLVGRRYEALIMELNMDDESTVSYVDSVLKCAELLTYSPKHSMSIDMFNYASFLYDNNATKALMLKSLMIKSGLEERWHPLQQGSWFVPFLSLAVYHRDYARVASNAEYYLKQYRSLVDQQSEKSDWELMFGMMNNMTFRMLEVNKLTVKNSKELLEMSRDTVRKLREQYGTAIKEADDTKNTLLAGIEAQKQAATYSYWERLFFGTQALFEAVRSFDVVSIVVAGKELWDGYNDHTDTIATLSEVANACDKMMEMLNSKDLVIEKVEVYMKDLDKASSLKLRLVEWDLISPQVNSVLKGLDGIDGLAAYELAIERLSNWGRKLTEEVISQAVLIRQLGEKVAMLDAKKDQSATTSGANKIAAFRRRSVEDQRAILYRSLFDERLELLEMKSYYCQSYYHFYLHECDDSMQPNAHDDLQTLILKTYQTEGISHKSLAMSMRQPPQRFQETLIIKDEVEQDEICNSAKKCPVTTFINTKMLTYTIPLDHPLFITYDRVRMEEIEVKLIGVKAQGSYTLAIRTSPNFSDRLKNTVFNFTTPSRALTYKYDMNTNVVNTQGTIHGEYEGLFSEISPFTDWTISFEDKFNNGVDFSTITEIQLAFKGNAISRVVYKKKR